MSELKRVKDWNWHQKYLEQLGRAKETEDLNRQLIKFLKVGIAHAWMNRSWEPSSILGEALEQGLIDRSESESIYRYSEHVKKVGGDL